jgi:hypothetical protein
MESVLSRVEQHPDLLSGLAYEDAHECRATSSARVVLLDLRILHCASACQCQSAVGLNCRWLAVEFGAWRARLNPEIHSAFSQSKAEIVA